MRYVCQLGDGFMLAQQDAMLYKVETGYPYPDLEAPQMELLAELLSLVGVIRNNDANEVSKNYSGYIKTINEAFSRSEGNPLRIEDVFLNRPVNCIHILQNKYVGIYKAKAINGLVRLCNANYKLNRLKESDDFIIIVPNNKFNLVSKIISTNLPVKYIYDIDYEEVFYSSTIQGFTLDSFETIVKIINDIYSLRSGTLSTSDIRYFCRLFLVDKLNALYDNLGVNLDIQGKSYIDSLIINCLIQDYKLTDVLLYLIRTYLDDIINKNFTSEKDKICYDTFIDILECSLKLENLARVKSALRDGKALYYKSNSICRIDIENLADNYNKPAEKYFTERDIKDFDNYVLFNLAPYKITNSGVIIDFSNFLNPDLRKLVIPNIVKPVSGKYISYKDIITKEYNISDSFIAKDIMLNPNSLFTKANKKYVIHYRGINPIVSLVCNQSRNIDVIIPDYKPLLRIVANNLFDESVFKNLNFIDKNSFIRKYEQDIIAFVLIIGIRNTMSSLDGRSDLYSYREKFNFENRGNFEISLNEEGSVVILEKN